MCCSGSGVVLRDCGLGGSGLRLVLLLVMRVLIRWVGGRRKGERRVVNE